MYNSVLYECSYIYGKKKKLPELPSKDYEAIPVSDLIILLLLVLFILIEKFHRVFRVLNLI